MLALRSVIYHLQCLRLVGSLIIYLEESRPVRVSRLLPVHFFGTILQPVGQGHVTRGQIKSIGFSILACGGILLREHEAHNLGELDVVEEELDVDRIGCVIGRAIDFVVVEVVFGHHLDIGIFRVDAAWSSQSHGDRAVSSEQAPPDSLPQSLIGLAELGCLNTGIGRLGGDCSRKRLGM